MSSPPSLENLKISSTSPTTKLPPSPPSSDGDNGETAETKPNDPNVASKPEPTPPATPGIEVPAPSVPDKSTSPTSPTTVRPTQSLANGIPNAATASGPSARPTGQPMRGGLQGRPSARGMGGPMGMRGGAPMQSRLPPSLQAKMDKIAAQRQGAPPPQAPQMGGIPNPNATSMGALLRSQALGGGVSAAPSTSSIPGPASGPLGLAARRAGGPPRPNLGQMGMGLGGQGGKGPGVAARRMGPPGGLNLASMGGGSAGGKEGSKFTDFNKIMDPSGSLRFSSKAVLTAKGVEFEDGASFKINMDEMDIVGELGKGNYGSVQQVYHRPSNIMMAMKEIRLELDESKLNGIIMELDILHRAVSPEIVEFYGAFTIESCVYYCMELMDAGSLDTLTGGGAPLKPGQKEPEGEHIDRVPEDVLRRITCSMVKGLKFLKDELQIMHRDVKPTNVLINKKGEVKLVDFGVSGQLEKSLAKTNIGCQSYMAPERIKGESQNQVSTYTVSSDVWSVGLSIIELAKGCYPYPPETFANVFAQLQAIVYGPAPTLPPGYSADANDFVAKCLIKDPNSRPTYAQLLEHPFLACDKDSNVDIAGWVVETLERRAARGLKHQVVSPTPPVPAVATVNPDEVAR